MMKSNTLLPIRRIIGFFQKRALKRKRGSGQKLWMRLGISFEIPQEEVRSILSGDPELAEKTLRTIISEGRFYPDGDSYIPAETIEIFNSDYGTEYEVDEVSVDF